MTANLILTLKPVLNDDICVKIAQALSPLGCEVLNGCHEDIRYYFTDMEIAAPDLSKLLPRIIETLQEQEAPLASSLYDISSGQDHLVYAPDQVLKYCQDWDKDISSGKLTYPQANSQQGLRHYSLAQCHIALEQNDDAISALSASFEAAPYIPLRNNKATLWLLEQGEFEKALPFIKLRFSEDIEDGDNRVEWHRKALVKTIAPLALSLDGELESYPQIMAYYHHILHIQSTGDTSSEQAAISLCEKHKECSEAWKLLGDIHYEAEDYKKASKAYLRYFRGDDPQLSNYLQYMIVSFLKAGKDLEEIDLGTHGSARGLYNAAAQLICQLDEEILETEKVAVALKKIQAPLYAKSYELFYNYYITSQGSACHSGQHTFAMCCNNYANSLTEDLPAEPDDKQKSLYRKAYEIHRLGYEVSPFYENLYSGANDAYYADDYDELIRFSETFFADYKHSEHYIGSDVFLEFYNYIVWAYWQKNDYQNMVSWYQKAEELFQSISDPDDDQIDEFLKTAYYCGHELDRLEREKDHKAFLSHLRELRDWKALEKEIYAEDREDDFSAYAIDMLDDLTDDGKFGWTTYIGFMAVALVLLYLGKKLWTLVF